MISTFLCGVSAGMSLAVVLYNLLDPILESRDKKLEDECGQGEEESTNSDKE